MKSLVYEEGFLIDDFYKEWVEKVNRRKSIENRIAPTEEEYSELITYDHKRNPGTIHIAEGVTVRTKNLNPYLLIAVQNVVPAFVSIYWENMEEAV